jgi:trans-2-enoyl-CoA reductase
VVNLSYHSEQFDVEDYITSLDDDVFSEDLKNRFIDSVKKYFSQKSSSVTTSSNSTELL